MADEMDGQDSLHPEHEEVFEEKSQDTDTVSEKEGGIAPSFHQIKPAQAKALRRLRRRRKHYTMFVTRTQRRRSEQQRSSVARAWMISIAVFMAIIVGSAATAAQAAVTYYQQEKVVLDSIAAQVVNNDSIRLYDMHGTLLYQVNSDGIKRSICYNQMPMVLQNATVAIEDKTFWQNPGIDFNRIAAAELANLKSHSIVQGASTITQQLLKNTVLGPETTYDRKLREAILAIGLTQSGEYSKQKIMEMYLNTVPYGPYIYGLDAAAHTYFGYTDDPNANRDCTTTNHGGLMASQHLTLAQSSFLAAIPKDPNLYNPLTKTGFDNDLSRQKDVLDSMVKLKYITPQEEAQAIKESHSVNFLSFQANPINLAPHFVQYALNQLSDMVDSGTLTLSRSGLSIYTTLDLPLQQRVQKFMTDHLFGNEVDDYGTLIRNDNVSDAAAVLLQQSTGSIRVLLGSWDPNATRTPFGKPVDGAFDVATQGFRQQGSTFKPLMYTAAFEKGWFPAMTITDEPTIFPGPAGSPVYKPLDAYRGVFEHQLTIRQALQHSLDIPAVKTLQFVGIDYMLQALARFGVTQYKGTPGLSMALGALDVRPIDVAHAFSVLADYGRSLPLNSIDYIADAQGNVIYKYVPPRGDQVFSPQVTYLTTSVITDNQTRAPAFGICSPLRLYTSTHSQCAYQNNPGIDYPAAAKTGTTDNLTNDWASGYTMDYTGTVWVGNSNEADGMHDIDGITGAAPIWYKMMLAAEGCTNPGSGSSDGCSAPKPFPIPQGVSRATFTSNGITSTDWFDSSNVPTVQGVGNGGAGKYCITLHDSDANAWDYCKNPQPTATPTSTATPGGGGNH